MSRCLLVDDDNQILVEVAAYLARFGLEVTPAATAAQMRSALTDGSFDIVVLDVMLPDDNGLALCRWIRDNGSTPVIMLTAQGDPLSRVLGLELGADDFIGKPFEPRELVARINAVLRRASRAEVPNKSRRSAAGSDRFSGWSLDRTRHVLVSPSKVVVSLSNAECRLLVAFIDHAGQVLSRERLNELTTVAGVEVNDRNVDLAVSRLRQKLGNSPQDPVLIRTVRGEGYLFAATIDE